MISEQVALEQLDRLRQLQRFPGDEKDGAALKELMYALMGAATDTIAEQVISEFSMYSVQCPFPADIRRMVWERNEKLEQEPKEKCPRCYGSGWAITYWLHTHEPNRVLKEKLPFEDVLSFSEYKANMDVYYASIRKEVTKTVNGRKVRESVLPEGTLRQEVIEIAERCACNPKPPSTAKR